MRRLGSKLGLARILLLAVAIILISVSWLGMARMDDGLIVRKFTQDGVPLRFIQPEEGENLPGVIVAHGFGGSSQLMLGYGYAFARAGYAVMLLDFTGHATNPNPLSYSRDLLQDDLDIAYQALTAQPNVNASQIALLGHSMGSGAVLEAGIARPDRYGAVIAISPTDARVSETRPPNLMLQAGSLEGRFVANAQALLARAGGPNDDFAEKRARRLAEIPGVEHTLILFSADSQERALEWLNSSFGLQKQDGFKDRRLAWNGLHQFAWVVIALAIGPLVARKPAEVASRSSAVRRWLGLLLSPFVATGLFWWLSTQLDPSGILGLQVGGGLGLWLFVMGLCFLIVSVRLDRPRWQSAAWGGGLFAFLWVGLGLSAQFTILQWFLIPSRLWRWPILALACLPWKLAIGHMLRTAGGWRKAVVWVVQSVVLVAALVMTALWVPGMFVIMLIAPILPLILGAEILIGHKLDDAWGFGIGSALLFGWLISAFFPLA